MSGWIALLKRDVMLASRLGGGGFVGVIFFLSLVVLAPFALGPDLNLLARIGPALLWIAALLATLIGLDRLFQADEEDGSLDLMRMGDMPMLLVVLAKGIAHWLTTGLPLTLAAPVLGLLLAIEPKVLGVVMLSLVIGTPALTFIGAVGAALTVSVRRGGLSLGSIVVASLIAALALSEAS